MSGSLVSTLVLAPLRVISEMMVKMNEIHVYSVDQLITFIQTLVQMIIELLIVVFFENAFPCRQI
jgi:hypothetical protein